MEKISIIIPTYNNSKLLVRCIESVLKQTYPNIEIIVVDDGSTDETKKVFSKFKGKSSFKYIYQNNAGVSSARNNGIKEATGNYIMFLDSDDFYEEKYCEKMVNQLIDTDSDMCVSGINYIRNSNGKKDFYMSNKVFNSSDIISFVSENICNYLLYPVWNKLYKKELLSNISFDSKLKVGEDFVFNLDYIGKCRKITYVVDNYYNYIISENNTTAKMKKYNTIISISNEIDYSNRIDNYLIKLGFDEKLLKKRRLWNYSLSYNKVCNNVFAINNPYTKKERKKIIKTLKKSIIGIYSRKNIKNKAIFLLSHSAILSYFIYSIKSNLS